MCLYKYKRIAITERNLYSGEVEEYVEHLLKLAEQLDVIIVREKNMEKNQYRELASILLAKGTEKKADIFLHTHLDIARELKCKNIHLTFSDFVQNVDNLYDFNQIGVSTHSLEEGMYAMHHRVSYITASHIFATDCKKDLEPKGLDFLREICSQVSIPVYALGGIKKDNEMLAIENGASGVCQMSGYMKKENI
jgi:thiamine-phosphate pyrophosphorylase